METYRIEVRDPDTGRWILAPGEATGYTEAEARRVVEAGGSYWLDGTPIEPLELRYSKE